MKLYIIAVVALLTASPFTAARPRGSRRDGRVRGGRRKVRRLDMDSKKDGSGSVDAPPVAPSGAPIGTTPESSEFFVSMPSSSPTAAQSQAATSDSSRPNQDSNIWVLPPGWPEQPGWDEQQPPGLAAQTETVLHDLQTAEILTEEALAEVEGKKSSGKGKGDRRRW